MATLFSSALRASSNTDALFRAWVQFVNDTLTLSGGWIYVPQTGDADPTTILKPTAANSKMGFRVYRMNDALQSTKPVFMRIDYGGSQFAAPCGGIWVTIGPSVNGSGVVNTPYFDGGSVTQSTVSGTSYDSVPNVNTNCYGSAGPNRLSIGMFIQANTTYPWVLSIERTKSALGVDTGEGLLMLYSRGAGEVNTSRYVILANDGPQPTAETGLNYALSWLTFTEAFGGDLGLGVVIHFKGIAQQPGTNMLISNTLDVATEGRFSTTLYGQSITYQKLNVFPPTKAKAGTSQQVTDANARCCIRYE